MPAALAFAPISGGERSAAEVETARQYALVRSEAVNRVALTTLAYVFCAAYLPIWMCILGAALNLGFELINMRLMQGLDPVRDPARNIAMLASGAVGTSIFVVTAGLIWLQSHDMAHAFAVGMIMLTLVNQSSVRSVNLQVAVVGLVTTGFWVVVFIVLYWWGTGAIGAMVFALALSAAAFAHLTSLMLHNNAMHRASLAAESAAMAADAAKSQFLAQMSHELRLPLNAILGMGDLELSQARNDASRKRLQLLVTSGRDLSAILDDILDLSAVEKDALVLHYAPCDPRDVIAAACDLLRPQLAAKGLVLREKIAQDVPARAVLDARRMRQCILNLIANAGKFTETGYVQMDCTLAGGLLQIDVVDTGGGIAADRSETIFDPFHRGAGLQTGTGLGLTIGRKLARAMGGDLVLVPSSLGAHFRLTARLQPEQAIAMADTQVDDFAHMSVLVVDDIVTNHLVAAAYLSMLGVTPRAAHSGIEALALLAQIPFDLVLMDMNMPGLSGLETLERIRKMPVQAGETVVVAMTSNDSTFDHGRYQNAALQGHLMKPLSLETMRAVLRIAAAKRRSLDARGAAIDKAPAS